jgi:hypothetical protein
MAELFQVERDLNEIERREPEIRIQAMDLRDGVGGNVRVERDREANDLQAVLTVMIHVAHLSATRPSRRSRSIGGRHQASGSRSDRIGSQNHRRFGVNGRGFSGSAGLSGKSLPAIRIRQVDIDEEPIGDLAATLGITTNNPTVRLHRARKELRERLLSFSGRVVQVASERAIS